MGLHNDDDSDDQNEHNVCLLINYKVHWFITVEQCDAVALSMQV